MRRGHPRSIVWLLTLSSFIVCSGLAFRWTSEPAVGAGLTWAIFAVCLALLVPIGLALLSAGGWLDYRAADAALMGIVSLALAVVGYFLTGFAFQFGGIGLLSSSAGLRDLIWEWSFLDVNWGLGWGMLGLRGFALGGEASSPEAHALFMSQIAPLSVVVLLPLLALRGRVKAIVLVVGSLLTAMVLYPLAGNWVWGGGWLANLGANLDLGHGFVDFAGAGTIHLLGAAVALAALLAFPPPRREGAENGPAQMPPVHLPVLAVLGSFLALVGWLGLPFVNPLLAEARISWPTVVVNLVMAAAGGAMLALAYSWFTTGIANVFMTSRGLVCGLVAISAACPFVPVWLALLIGAFAGLLLSLTSYLFTYVFRLADDTLILPIHGISAVWGLLAVGLFADGRYGRGWNGVGIEQYLNAAGQGVTGLLTPAGIPPDFPQQLYAQLIGLAAIGVFAFVVAWVVFKVLYALGGAVREPQMNTDRLAENTFSPPGR